MTISNGYASSGDFTARVRITSTDTTDDGVIDSIIEAASRVIDSETRRTFYARGTTRYYDVPNSNWLYIEDDDLLTITKLTNGDGTEISSGDYLTLPYNENPKYAVKIKDSSTVTFEFDSTNNGERAISISGSWGYCTSTPADIKEACLQIASNYYHKRFGEGDSSETTITAGGVVITAKDIPASARAILDNYARLA